MNEFARGFLNENWPPGVDRPRVFVGAFGKHPGWNDHLDDIGLATASLIEARRVIYSGIAQQIESAAWERARPDRVAAGFNHLLHWRRPHESLTGFMWSSQDGKGRALYPMVTLAHCIGRPFSWVADMVVPVLASTGAECRATTAASAVITAITRAQQRLAREAAQSPPPRPDVADGAAWQTFVARESEPLLRVMHHVRHQLAIFAPGTRDWYEPQPASRTLRVPRLPDATVAESIDAWVSVLSTQVDAAVPILAMAPLDHSWVDLILGIPAPADFFVLRALLTAFPQVTDIPYQIDALLAADMPTLLSRSGLPVRSVLNGTTAGANFAVAEQWLDRCRAKARPGLLRRWLGAAATTPRR